MSRFDAMEGRPIYLSWQSKSQEEHGAVPKKLKFDREAFETFMQLLGGHYNNAFWKFYDGRATPTEMAVKMKSGRVLNFWKPESFTTHLGFSIQEDLLRSPILIKGDGLIITWECLREIVRFAEALIPTMEKESIQFNFPYGSLHIDIGKEGKADTTLKFMGESIL